MSTLDQGVKIEQTCLDQSNAYEDPQRLGGPSVNTQPSLPPPSYYASNSQSTTSVPASALPRLANSLIFYQIFLQGKPKALGIVLIITAILQIALGVALIYTGAFVSLPSGIPFWGAINYIIAGTLTVLAEAKPNTCLIKSSLALNIITSVISAIGLILAAADLFLLPFVAGYSYDYETSRPRINDSLAIVSILLITNLLLFCVSISISVFGCKSLGHVSGLQQVLVIQNDIVHPVSPSMLPATPPGYVQTISSSGAAQPPPPYFI